MAHCRCHLVAVCALLSCTAGGERRKGGGGLWRLSFAVSEVSTGNVGHDDMGTFVLPATDQEIHENILTTLSKFSV